MLVIYSKYKMRTITGNTVDKQTVVNSLLLGLAVELQNHHLQ